MTIAPTSSWNPAVSALIRQSLFQAGAIAEDEDPTAEMYATAIFQLNGIVKSAEATGLHVWTEEEAILFLQPGQAKYIIGGPTPSLNAHTADADAWEQLTLTTAAAGGATSVLVNTIIGVSSGDNIGVILNDQTTFWTTVNGAPSGSTIDLTDPIPAVAASAGTYALTYTTPITRPLKVPNARQKLLTNGNETPMTILSRQEYMDLPNKVSPGSPTQWFYSPRRDQGFLYIWQPSQVTNYAVRFTWYRPIADLLVPNNTMDFPQEWVLPLMWRLAYELAPGYNCPPLKVQILEKMAGTYDDLVISYDRESEPVQFGMSYEATQGA